MQDTLRSESILNKVGTKHPISGKDDFLYEFTVIFDQHIDSHFYI